MESAKNRKYGMTLRNVLSFRQLCDTCRTYAFGIFRLRKLKNRSTVLDDVRMMSKILNQMKIFYGTKALWVSFSVITIEPVHYLHIQLPNTNFTETKVDTDRLTNRYIWKATKQRLEEHYSSRPYAQQPRLDWPGEYSRPIPSDIVIEDENTTTPLLHRSRKRPSLVDPEKDKIDKTRAFHNYFFAFLDEAKKYQSLKAEF